MLNIPKNFEMDHNRMKHDLLTAYRRITWKIWVYLKANPDILASNNNQEVFDEVARIQTARLTVRAKMHFCLLREQTDLRPR